MEKDINVSIKELFLAKCGIGDTGFDRCFYGTIRRENRDGKPIVFGNINVNDGHIIANADDQWQLGNKLDQILILVLDKGIHNNNKGVFLMRYGFEYNFN